MPQVLEADHAVLAPDAEAAQPLYARYWLHNRGPAPLGGLPAVAHLHPQHVAAEPDSQVAAAAYRGQRLHRLGAARQGAAGVPDGWTADPAELPFVLPPGEHLEADVVVTMPPDTAAGALSGARRTRGHRKRRGVDAARVAPGGRGRLRGVGRQTAADEMLRLISRARAGRGGRGRGRAARPSPSAPTRMRDLAVEAHLISPWGTWEWMGPAAVGARTARPGRRWSSASTSRRRLGGARRVVGADPGRLRRPAALLARGEGDGADEPSARRGHRRGRAVVRSAEVDAREARLRGDPCSRRRCRGRGTSEGRQLRRWLTQLLVTERVVAAEAAARRTDGRRCAERGRAAARHHGPAGDRQRRGLGACRSAGPGAVRARHRRRRHHRRRRADYHARNPRRFAQRRAGGWRRPRRTAARRRATAIAEHLRRRPSPRVPALAGRPVRRTGRARTGLRASRRPASARQHPQALMDVSACARHRRHEDRRRARRRRRRAGAPRASCRRPTVTPKRCGQWSTRWSPRRSPRPAARVRGVGIASAGPDRPAGRHRQPDQHHRSGNGFPIVERVSTLTGAPVRLGGDGLCMALGERWRGAGRGAAFLLGMVVSTGVGGGLVLDGAPYDGRTGNAGHVGHVVVDPDGAPCTCGGRGCVETIAVRPANGAVGPRERLGRAAGGRRQGTRRRRQRGDPVALQAFRRGATAVAAMIASVGAVCDLDLVVIGGGVAKSGRAAVRPAARGAGRLRPASTSCAG